MNTCPYFNLNDPYEIILFRFTFLNDYSQFSINVLNDWAFKMISFCDAGRLVTLLFTNYDWSEFIYKYLNESNNNNFTKLIHLLSNYITKYKSLRFENHIETIGHIGWDTRANNFENYKYIFNIEINDNHIVRLNKFLKSILNNFIDISKIISEIYDISMSDNSPLKEDYNYFERNIGEEKDNLNNFINTVSIIIDYIDSSITKCENINDQIKYLIEISKEDTKVKSIIDSLITNFIQGNYA